MKLANRSFRGCWDRISVPGLRQDERRHVSVEQVHVRIQLQHGAHLALPLEGEGYSCTTERPQRVLHCMQVADHQRCLRASDGQWREEGTPIPTVPFRRIAPAWGGQRHLVYFRLLMYGSHDSSAWHAALR